ncbi:hypothetical protein JHK84_045123 [Glycine max]|nr:hypothetical protein JHK84_045123 [Glycine max]
MVLEPDECAGEDQLSKKHFFSLLAAVSRFYDTKYKIALCFLSHTFRDPYGVGNLFTPSPSRTFMLNPNRESNPKPNLKPEPPEP